MFARLALVVTRHWTLIAVLWLLAVVAVRLVAPPWDRITHDGDFAYLPAQMPSVLGEQWMTEAFPRQRGRSQVVVAVVRHDAAMTNDDIHVAYDVARRLKNLFGATRLAKARELVRQESDLRRDGQLAEAEEVHNQFVRATEQADEALEEALLLDERLADYWGARVEQDARAAAVQPPRLPQIYHNRALLDTLLGDREAAAEHRSLAVQLDPTLAGAGDQVLPEDAPLLPLVDAWTWRESYFGDKLVSRDNRVRLVVLQLTNEFMAVDNIRAVRQIEAALAPVRGHLSDWTASGLSVLQSGSAAVGADLLRSAASSIKHTELFTVVLVVLILALVYRAPLLVALPIVTILASLLVSTGLVALLTQLADVPGFSWWTLKVFSTTKIFIIVILFGAGTDYCLFLIARYKEELQKGLPHDEAVAAALTHVGNALAANSPLTTIVGLGMMYFAEFGKFCYSGPVIGLCLAITLLTCVTLTPAIMTGLGPLLFWPWGIGRPAGASSGAAGEGSDEPRKGIWPFIAHHIVARPGTILLTSVLVLMPVAVYGILHGHDVTYDFLSGLPRKCPSKQGAEALRDHFPIGESGPVTVLVQKVGAQFDSPEGREQIRSLSEQLYVPGVATVRSAEDPLGEYAPGEKSGILSERGRRLRGARVLTRETRAIFVAQTPELAGNVVRLELLLEHDPFSLEAIQVVDRVENKLNELIAQEGTFWSNARYALTGTTAAIRDLRDVTRRDNVRIQILVVLAVFVVLLLLLKRPGVCFYMMLTVLFSYYITIGSTTLFFSVAYGESYQGLDWKVPLFLFVILVAVGQDYNVYLATRVFEEQARLGPFAGLRRAVVCTGGIITSCGVIMAGTFLSMTSGTWGDLLPGLPARVSPPYGALHSIVEMGFALALGVLLDTFVVRPILVPSFLALVCRWRGRAARPKVEVPGLPRN